MSTLDDYIERITELKKKGLSDSEIARELKISSKTLEWFLAQDIRGDEAPPPDVMIGWRSIGVMPKRAKLIAAIMVDIIEEELAKETSAYDETLDLVVVGVAHDGVIFANFVAEMLNCDLAIYRPHRGDGSGVFAMNSASVADKNVIIIDDILGTGETVRGVLKAVKEAEGIPILVLELVNKTEFDQIDGVPLRALLRAHVVR
ncbi:MAG TPA: orotate phosphoribosyltransferase-like protein [Thermoplasmata archaeon]|nr:orotate phosphoribosyltransferase-like protein [Thermoplasmata archaeon]